VTSPRLSFYGTRSYEVPGVVPHEWDRDWGARPVACWGAMLQLVVERPPSCSDAAFTVAGQFESVVVRFDMEQRALYCEPAHTPCRHAELPRGASWRSPGTAAGARP
jgi:hypothetical protein